MTFHEFIEAVDNLVREWNQDDPTLGRVPREQLQAIYNAVREQAVYDLAVMQLEKDASKACLTKPD